MKFQADVVCMLADIKSSTDNTQDPVNSGSQRQDRSQGSQPNGNTLHVGELQEITVVPETSQRHDRGQGSPPNDDSLQDGDMQKFAVVPETPQRQDRCQGSKPNGDNHTCKELDLQGFEFVHPSVEELFGDEEL